MMWWLQNRKTKKRWDWFDGECDYPANETIKDRGKCKPGGPEFQRKNTRKEGNLFHKRNGSLSKSRPQFNRKFK